MRRRLTALVVLLAAAGAGYAYFNRRPATIVLTGIVTTNDVVVSPQVAGQIARLLVAEGDSVAKDQLVAVINPEELKADTAYYSHNVAGLTSQVRESEAALRFEERQTADQVRQAESTLDSIGAQVASATAELEQARITLTRTQDLSRAGVVSPQELDQARAAVAAAQGKVDALKKQAEAQRSAIALARSNAEQVAVRRSQVQANEHLQAAADAQRAKADGRLRYAEFHAPIDGIVDVRAVRVGEVVTPGQPIVTLINPEDLWVRADVEESYIDRVRIGDALTVRLPSGVERQGKVFYRGADASFATQRDVSRTKRDIKTFEIRIRVDNSDRRLAVGMTAYVLLPTQ